MRLTINPFYIYFRVYLHFQDEDYNRDEVHAMRELGESNDEEEKEEYEDNIFIATQSSHPDTQRGKKKTAFKNKKRLQSVDTTDEDEEQRKSSPTRK